MLNDPLQKTVKIPIRIVGGKPVFFYGGELPRLKEGIIGDLVLPSYAVLDEDKLLHLEEELECAFLPKGTRLLANVRREMKSAYLLTRDNEEDLPWGTPGGFVELYLSEDLKMKMRGTKTPVLESCPCFIPALDEQAISVNHAYTLISTKFEPERKSHTGNVFTKVFSKAQNGHWRALDDLRQSIEAEFEQRYVT
jgi:hypothetical protein